MQIVPELVTEEVTFTLDTDDDSAGDLHPAFNRERFLFRQKLMTISEKYVVWDDEERPILFIERPAHFWRHLMALLATVVVFLVTFVMALIIGFGLTEQVQPKWVGGVALVVLIVLSFFLTGMVMIAIVPKRHISFYADESKGELLLQVKQDRKFHFLVATYTVVNPGGECLGHMRKNYLYNFLRKRWDVLAPESKRLLLVAREDSLLLSLMRRFLGPMFGFLRTNFILVMPGADGIEATRGEFNRKFTIFDRYVLDLTRDRPRMIDRRLAVALGVLLDTGEHR